MKAPVVYIYNKVMNVFVYFTGSLNMKADFSLLFKYVSIKIMHIAILEDTVYVQYSDGWPL